jgi:hypothetical protein
VVVVASAAVTAVAVVAAAASVADVAVRVAAMNKRPCLCAVQLNCLSDTRSLSLFSFRCRSQQHCCYRCSVLQKRMRQSLFIAHSPQKQRSAARAGSSVSRNDQKHG